MWTKVFFALMVVIFLFSSCSSKKKLSSSNSTLGANEVVLNDGLVINNLDFRTFSGRAKSRVEFGKDKQDFTLHVRVDRDKAVWMSMTATLVNYEVARVLITPDSIKIMNRLQSEYLVKPFDYIHKYTGKGLDFSMLQDILLANVNKKLLRTDLITVANTTDETQLVGVNDGLSFQYSLNESKRPKVFRLNTVGSKDNLEAFYSSFAAMTGYSFPQNQNLNLGADYISINAILNYNKVEFNEPVEMPFTVPAKYNTIN